MKKLALLIAHLVVQYRTRMTMLRAILQPARLVPFPASELIPVSAGTQVSKAFND